MNATSIKVDTIRHERFCLPRPGLVEPRIEKFAAATDDLGTGRSRPSHDVTRCMECGAATYIERI